MNTRFEKMKALNPRDRHDVLFVSLWMCSAAMILFVDEEWLRHGTGLEAVVAKIESLARGIALFSSISTFPQTTRLFLSWAWAFAIVQTVIFALFESANSVETKIYTKQFVICLVFIPLAVLFFMMMPGISAEHLQSPGWKRVIWQSISESKLILALVGSAVCTVCAALTASWITAVKRVLLSSRSDMTRP